MVQRVESGSEMRDRRPHLQFILDRFQEGLTEVANTERVEGTTIEDW